MTQANTLNDEFAALVDGKHNNPFAVLGPHRVDGGRVVRTLQPEAAAVALVDADGNQLAEM